MFFKFLLFFSFIITFAHAKDTINFAPLPLTNKKNIYEQFYPFINYLEKKLDVKINLIYSESYNNIIKKFSENKIDLAYLGPLPFVKLKEIFPQAQAILYFNESKNSSKYTCSIVKFMKNENKSKIALTQKLSTCGYLTMDNFLNNKLENYEYRYLFKHDEVALSIIRGEYDLGAVRSSIYEEFKHLGLQEIKKSIPFPSFALVVNKSTISEDFIKRIENLLMNTNEEIFKNWGKFIKNGFSLANEDDYILIKEMLDNISIDLLEEEYE